MFHLGIQIAPFEAKYWEKKSTIAKLTVFFPIIIMARYCVF